MSVRQAYRAGSFYEADPESCRREVQSLVLNAAIPSDLPSGIVGGIVPHAGWIYSGLVAMTTLKALDIEQAPATVVLLGADHFGTAFAGEVYDRGAWATPLGEIAIDEALAADVVAADARLAGNCSAHAQEHSLEVQVPLIQLLWPQAKLVPILLSPSTDAVDVGRAIGRAVKQQDQDVAIVGSTDLTHHGGHFGAPGGHGKQGVEWSVANDRRMIDLMEAMDAEHIVGEAHRHGNACGAGAIAATVAACAELGATAGRCVQYTNSYEVMHSLYPGHSDDTTVGYASVVFA